MIKNKSNIVYNSFWLLFIKSIFFLFQFTIKLKHILVLSLVLVNCNVLGSVYELNSMNHTLSVVSSRG